jgi:DegV family protein with EDD domain
MAIKIIVDSASDINEQEAKELGVILLPMQISFGTETFYDGVEITPTQFYERLIESDELPKTSQVTPYAFEEAFEKCVNNGDQAIAITISSKLSATYFGARQAAEKFSGKVWVVDSLNACVGERLLCQYALRLIKQGRSAEEIVQALETAKGKVNVMAMIGTLEYLKKGGRISAATAFAGELLSLKPVVAIVDGEVKMIGKAMGSKKGNNLLNRIVQEKGGIDFSMPFGVVWSGLDKTLLEKYVKDSAALWSHATSEVPAYILGGTIGTHIGPGAIGVAFFQP